MSKKQFRILVTLVINLVFVVIEFIGGFLTNSVAIISDAIHDTGDVVVLTGSLFFEKAAEKEADKEHTFGHQRFSLVASVLSSLVLMSGGVFILTRAIPRLFNVEEVHPTGMVYIAILGVIFNGAAFFVVRQGTTINEKVLTWHMIEDVGGWVMVLLGATVISFTEWYILDPILSILFTISIFTGVTINLRKALRIFMQGVPVHIEVDDIRKLAMDVSGVLDIHDVHIWSMDGDEDIMSAHIVYGSDVDPFLLRNEIKEKLKSVHIEHATLELEKLGECTDEVVYEQPMAP